MLPGTEKELARREELPRRRFSVSEYLRMAEVGILADDERLELIDGEIVEMAAAGPRHIGCVNRLTELLVEFSARRYVVSVQNPLGLDEERMPEPDLALLRRNPGLTGRDPAVPAAGDALLAVEVTDTTHFRDRNVKLPRYARAGVPEVWIVDLRVDRVELYARSGAAALGGEAAGGTTTTSYAIARTHGLGEEVRSETVSGLVLSVDDILGYGGGEGQASS